MAQRASLGGDIYLAGTPTGGQNPKLFRPQRLGDLVFPGINMIMQPLYWAKFTVHLHDEGFDPADQEHLFLWAEIDGERVRTKSVLYYSLLSRYESADTGDDITVGSVLAKDWLFKSNFYDRIVNGLLTLITDPDEFDLAQFYEDVFSAEFKTDCDRHDVPIIDRLDEEFHAAGRRLDDKASEAAKFEAVAAGFVRAIQRCFDDSEQLHRANNRDETAIGATMDFTLDLIPEMSTTEKQILATGAENFQFSSEEAQTLLKVIARSEKGQFLIPSIGLVTFADPLSNPNLGGDDMPLVLKEVLESPERMIAEVELDLEELLRGGEPSESLRRVAFYWSLNYFLAYGETLARELISDQETILGTAIESKIQADSTAAREFREFYDKLATRDTWQEYLVAAINNSEEDDSELAEYLTLLLECSRDGTSPTECFIILLEQRNTIEQSAGEQYIIRAKPNYSDSASFYGVDELIGWTHILLESMHE